MTILLVLLGLLFILVLLRLLFSPSIEGFQPSQLDPNTVKSYNDFLDFYNSFCSNWDKAIQSSVASEIPQQPLTDPSQTQSSSSPQITDSQKNQYITQLSQELSQPLPPICTQLPPNIDSSSIQQVISLMPQSPSPYLNALNWMNQKMEQSHSNLNGALQGVSPPSESEGFEDTCQDISKCIANNPQLAKQLADEIAQQNAQGVQQQEQSLMNLLTQFLNNSDLMSASNNNKQLAQKSQDIQNQAQSGQLVNQVNVPGGNSQASYDKPEGGDKLTKMKQDNPQQYNQLQQNNTQLFNIKSLLEQINGAL
jgi:hypothetical protein